MKGSDYLILAILAIVIIIVLITTRKGAVEESLDEQYQKLYDINEEIGAEECRRRGMRYVGITSPDKERFEVFCHTKSPCKIYRFMI